MQKERLLRVTRGCEADAAVLESALAAAGLDASIGTTDDDTVGGGAGGGAGASAATAAATASTAVDPPKPPPAQ